MGIEDRLNELTRETLNFGDIISSTENPANADFRNACNLFSQYMEHQLQIINSSLVEQSSLTNIQNIIHQLHMLSNLIAPNSLEISNTYRWSNNLVDFCSQLQLLKSHAA
jgi:hypothetical protein